MPANDIYETQLWSTLQGDTANIFTFYFKVNTAPSTGTEEDDLNDHMNDHVVTNWLALLAPAMEFTCLDTKRIYESLGDTKSTSIPRQLSLTGQVGTDVGDSLPGQCSLVVQELTDMEFSDPSARGRSFYNGFVVDTQTDGVWDTVHATGFINILVTNLMGGFTGDNGGQYTWVQVSQKRLNTDPIPLGMNAEITQLRGLKQVRTQRRRQPLDPCDRYFTLQPG